MLICANNVIKRFKFGLFMVLYVCFACRFLCCDFYGSLILCLFVLSVANIDPCYRLNSLLISFSSFSSCLSFNSSLSPSLCVLLGRFFEACLCEDFTECPDSQSQTL